jgi:hypothetical protein
VDFADAYKHIAVAAEDTNLQWFEWGGMFFKELCLIFGGASSASIFDATAKVVLKLVCKAASFPRNKVGQHLDDICAAAPDGSAALLKFDTMFQEIAGKIGVQLADRSDPKKTFGPCKRGTVLGVQYDTAAWTWSIPAEKLVRLRLAMEDALHSDTIRAKQALSLVGKLLHIRPLLPATKYNIIHIMRLSGQANLLQEQNEAIEISAQCRRQLQFWLTLLKTCPGWMSIPLEVKVMPWALQAFTDAAGCSLDRLGAGTGGVCGPWWFYVPWASRINAGSWRIEGKKVGHKLSALELIGPLIVVAAAHQQLRGQQLVIWVDNAGAVEIWRKGYSTRCALASTIVTTIAAVSAAVGCTVFMRKITRCSNAGAVLADHLSKANFIMFRQSAAEQQWHLNLEPAQIPVALLRWIDRPCQSDDLAHEILADLAKISPILNYSV